jgi:hypothetical protein
MRKQRTAIIVAQVENFDPNRPDLNEFLNSLVAEAMENGPRTSRPPRRKKNEGGGPHPVLRSRLRRGQ